ncbi:MAG: LapA family protein [Agitococcus sp.]|nr:LapA family protein [Agitococcus sp.]MDO9180069.1 LapA family protein [Agitococcus sp.]
MSFNFVKRMLLAIMLIFVSFCGIWLVVTNPQPIHLNLLLLQIPAINSGLVILLTFVFGCVVGLAAAVVIFKILPLRWQLRQSQQQIAELRKQNAKPPLSL